MAGAHPPYANLELGGRLHWDERGVVLDSNPGEAIDDDPWVSPGFHTKLVYWRELDRVRARLTWPDLEIAQDAGGRPVQRYELALSPELTLLSPAESSFARAWDDHLDEFFHAVRKYARDALREGGWRAFDRVEVESLDALPDAPRRPAGAPFREAAVSDPIVFRWDAPRATRMRRERRYLHGLMHPARVLLGETYLYAALGDVRLRFPRRAFRGFVEVADGRRVRVHRWLFGRHAFLSLDRWVSEDLLAAMALEAPRLPRERAELTSEER